MLKRLGYRFVLRNLEHAPAAGPGGTMFIRMDWENIGVAPPYHEYDLALEFTPVAGGDSWRHVFSDVDLKTWLPGEHAVEAAVPVPSDLADGTYTLKVGMLFRHNQEPAIELAIEGKDDEGWYPLSELTVDASAVEKAQTAPGFSLEVSSIPFSSGADIAYTLAEAGHVSFFIYNHSGERIRSIAKGISSTGTHHMLWNGKSSEGEPVPSGLYLITMKMADRTISRNVFINTSATPF
jgi:hypothetical protein